MSVSDKAITRRWAWEGAWEGDVRTSLLYEAQVFHLTLRFTDSGYVMIEVENS